MIPMPQPRSRGTMSVEAALARRRSVREFRAEPLALDDVAQILWAGQGVTHADGHRTAPSAGGLYPLELYVLAGGVAGLDTGVYQYDPEAHALAAVAIGDAREAVARAALDQRWVAEAPAVLVFAAVLGRTTGKYGERGVRYVHVEVGHAAQNVYLQAEALGLGTTIVGAFRDAELTRLLGLGAGVAPLAIMPIGRA
ncbi:MAG TPA: SagB/ThcOx family dehydrogenase [Longimicrobiales bacterium]|nr:SagB/ThcOx family dehydrogenase [Longimicrobiales bacterium]